MPQLSIIVPVYNVEAYLPRCLDSILAQTFTDFEAILIDDGSPDRCGEIIDEYAKRDARIVPIHQKNGGVSKARNTGLEAARGAYIGFVDPDDWIEPEMYETMIRAMEENDADLVCCSWFDNTENGEERKHSVSILTTTFDRETFCLHLFDIPGTIGGSTCCKLFRKRLISKPFAERYTICEDNLFLAEYAAAIRKAAWIDRPFYHIFCRSNSAIRTIPDRVAYGLPARREIVSIAGTVSPECKMLAENVFLDQCITFCGKGRTTGEPYRSFAVDQYVSYWKENWRGILKNRMIPWKLKLVYLRELFRLKRFPANNMTKELLRH